MTSIDLSVGDVTLATTFVSVEDNLVCDRYILEKLMGSEEEKKKSCKSLPLNYFHRILFIYRKKIIFKT